MKARTLITVISASLVLCSCLASSYKATILITDIHPEHAYVQFDSFESQYVFKLRKTSKGEGNVHFTASLGKGKVTVSYVTFSKEHSLFTLNGGEKVDDYGIYIEYGSKVPIIIRSEGKVLDGTFTFDIVK